MIPRHQKLLFGILLLASLVMSVTLWQLRERAHQRPGSCGRRAGNPFGRQ